MRTRLRILCVHLPHLAIERSQRAAAQAGSAPTVLAGRAGATLRVERACPRAQRLGIRAGVTLGQAQAIAPGLRVLEHAPQRDRALLEWLAGWAQRFAPVAQPEGDDALLLDIGGCAHLFGGEAALAQQVARELSGLGLTARVAVADTVGASYALATCGGRTVVVAPEGQASAYLAALPPAALRIETGVASRLDALGVRSIGDLLMLPRSTLPLRFGAALVQRIAQALGELPEPLAAHRPRPAAAARFDFDFPVRDAGVLFQVARRLLDPVCGELAARGEALLLLRCGLRLESRQQVTFDVGFARATRSRRRIEALLRQRLETLRLPADAEVLEITAVRSEPWSLQQADLFDPAASAECDEALAELLERFVAQLGQSRVLAPRLLDDHQPEAGFRYEPAAGRPDPRERLRPARHSSSATGACHLPRRLLTLLLPRPEPVIVEANGDGWPGVVLVSGRRLPVAGVRGPVRLETGWWRGPDVRRDYYEATLADGRCAWLFRDLCGDAWRLHGWLV